jgi:hypothetical protein
MKYLVSLLLVSIFLVEYVAEKFGLSNPFIRLVPELLSAVFVLVIVGQALATRRWQQPRKHLVVISALVLTCLVGGVAETVAPGTLVAGLRDYFKFLPVFFLPAAVQFNRNDIFFVIGTYMFLAAIQVPIAFYQRFVEFAHAMHTGDPVTGTLTTSSALSIILCIAIAVVMTLYVNRKLTFPITAILFCYLAAPTAINETKATLLLLPLATLGPFILAHDIPGKWKRATPVFVLCGLGILGFIVVYNTLIQARWWGGAAEIGDFFAGGHVQTYLYRGVSGDNPPDVVGRLDSILIPIDFLSENWMQLLFGLGPGNVSPAFLPGMEGEYYEKYKDFGVGMTSIGNLLWELGIAGVLVYGCFIFFVWRDARVVSKSGAELKWLGDWWSVCTLILAIGLFYKHILVLNETAMVLFFFSGLIGSLRVRAGLVAEPSQPESDQAPVKLKLAGIENRVARDSNS